MSNLSRPKSKSEKEKDPQVQDRLQILLTRMLNEDDNKYCVDCDSKGNWYF
jgi:stromal membrane-associated protein